MPNMSLTKTPVAEQEPLVRNKNFQEVTLGYTPQEAMEEAQRCLHCKNRPCVEGCPVNIHIPEFIAKVAEGDFKAAYEIISDTNALPCVSGRVCPQESQCESRCVRGVKGEAVAIGRLERFVADWYLKNVVAAPQKPTQNGIRVAVVGSGPAGLTCASDLAKKGYEVTVFEAFHTAGGVLVYGIPEFRLPKAIVQSEVDKLGALGVEFRLDVVVGRTITIDELMEEGYKAVFVGSGAGLPLFMGIEGENLAGVYSANEYLTRVNLMKAYREDYDTPLRKSKAVAVVGGGNVAIDAARTAHRCGADSVAMYCLEPREKMPASLEEIAEAEEEDIAIQCGWGPKEVLTENGKVSGVVFMRCTSVWDSQGRFAPQYDEQDTITVPCGHVVLSIGQSVEWGGLLEGSKVELARGGWAKADGKTYQTAQPDVFVGGDVYTGPKFAIDAIAAGKEAAVSLHRFVQPDTSMTIGRDPRYFVELDKNNIKVKQYDTASRQIPGMDDSFDWKKSFRDAKRTFTEEQVKAETARCLGCGASIVDPNKCIGCGLCTTRCGFDAIHLHRERPECSTMIKSEDKMKAILPNLVRREIKIKRAAKRNRK